MKDFLGRGIAFPVGVDAYGALRTSVHEESVSEAVKSYPRDARRVSAMMRPEFGCAIHDSGVSPRQREHVRANLALHAREALVKWEPRVEEIQVQAYPDPTQENVILINIQYRVRRTNNMQNLVYPFFLRREQDL
jgi:phage baseplate assembly protein W